MNAIGAIGTASVSPATFLAGAEASAHCFLAASFIARFGTGELLDDIIARTKLPIRVQPSLHGEAIWISRRTDDGVRHVARYLNPAEAARVYRDLCRTASGASQPGNSAAEV